MIGCCDVMDGCSQAGLVRSKLTWASSNFLRFGQAIGGSLREE